MNNQNLLKKYPSSFARKLATTTKPRRKLAIQKTLIEKIQRLPATPVSPISVKAAAL